MLNVGHEISINANVDFEKGEESKPCRTVGVISDVNTDHNSAYTQRLLYFSHV
jgi:hypothetical protein